MESTLDLVTTIAYLRSLAKGTGPASSLRIFASNQVRLFDDPRQDSQTLLYSNEIVGLTPSIIVGRVIRDGRTAANR